MHTPSRRRFVGAALSAVIASATLPLPIRHAQAADPTHTHLVLGATAGYNYDVLKKAVVPQLEKDGYTVKLIEFNDYIQPNLALAEGSLDANLFQHITYLKRFAEDRKLDLAQRPRQPGACPAASGPAGSHHAEGRYRSAACRHPGCGREPQEAALRAGGSRPAAAYRG